MLESCSGVTLGVDDDDDDESGEADCLDAELDISTQEKEEARP